MKIFLRFRMDSSQFHSEMVLFLLGLLGMQIAILNALGFFSFFPLIYPFAIETEKVMVRFLNWAKNRPFKNPEQKRVEKQTGKVIVHTFSEMKS